MAIFNRKPKEETKLVMPINESLKVDLESGEVDSGKFITAIREVAYKRADLFKAYNEMVKDGVIDSALELISDDATQTDINHNHIVWVESPDERLKFILERFLHKVLKIDEKIWSWSYNLLQYGNVYINTHYDKYKDNPSAYQVSKGGDFFVEIETYPENIYHLMSEGKEEGFYKSEKEEQNKGVLYTNNQFVHLAINKGSTRKNEEDLVLRGRFGISETSSENKFKVFSGSSYLEQAQQPWKILRVLEDVLIMTRLSKASYFKLVSVEVGTATDKESRTILEKVKSKISNKEVLSALGEGDFYKSINNPAPLGQFIYLTTRDGKGAITIESVADDFNIKEIVDIEYFRDKLFASLKIPKAYLGYDKDTPGGIGDSSLTRLDIRYSRTVQRIQSILRNGVRSLCEMYIARTLTERGLSFVGVDWEICMTRISSAEDKERQDEIMNKTTAADSIISQALTNFEEYVDKEKLFDYIFGEMYGFEISKIKKEVIEEPVEDDEESEDGFNPDRPIPDEPETDIENIEDFAELPDLPVESVTMDRDGFVLVERVINAKVTAKKGKEKANEVKRVNKRPKKTE